MINNPIIIICMIIYITMGDENEFYFESDHLALKQNKDYHALLKSIVMLEAQRIRAIKDIDTIKLLEKEALNDPGSFIEKIKSNQDIGVPSQQVIVEIPKIDWSQYSEYLPQDIQEYFQRNRPEKIFSENSHSSPPQSRQKNVTVVQKDSVNDLNPQTSNRLWSLEEQKRLEELLIEYPPEPIEMRRFEKIAKALGNRTTKQVCSRVQKYFIKLRRAGLPIPGRIPKTLDRRSYGHKHQRNNKYLYRPSTFFPHLDVPVFMNESDDYAPGPSNSMYSVKSEDVDQTVDESSDDETMEIKEKVAASDTYKKIEIMHRVMREKRKENEQEYCEHLDYKCDFCDDEPIIGTRWHCENCTESSTDFCTNCVIAQLESDNCHPLEHKLTPIRIVYSNASYELLQKRNSVINNIDKNVAKEIFQEKSKVEVETDAVMKIGNIVIKTEIPETSSLYDADYLPESFIQSSEGSSYNYLDPNFLPQ